MNSNPAKIQVIDLSYPRKVHFIGIGGMGMSGLAQILLKQGHSVSGSDIDDNNINIERIKALGGRVYGNHDKGNIKKAEIVVYSSCISDNNPEIIQSKANGLEIIPRAVVLAELMKGKRSIAVSGTHGKTTVSALISLIVSRAGLEPTIIVGGELEDFNNNACKGRGQYLVAEADESDASFLYLNQTYSVITNIEPDHMDYYHNMDQVLETYEKFINNTSTNGFVAGCLDDAHILSLRQKTDKKFITYGLSAQADLRADNICLKDLGSEFDLIYHNKNLGRITIQIPGEYNILNALSACALTLGLGIEFFVIKEALLSYKGVGRRFEIKLNTARAMVIDDYAHHPTEIQAVITAGRAGFKGRLIGVFQPHRYTRTKLLVKEYSVCFQGLDELILTDVYSAGEAAIEGVSGENIYKAVTETGQERVVYIEDKANIIPYLLKITCSGDRILMMGAGDITKIADELAERLSCSIGKHKLTYTIKNSYQ